MKEVGSQPLLDVSDLRVRFKTDEGSFAYLDRLSFHVQRGEILGIVGESGSGKSITCLALMRLLEKNGAMSAASIRFDGEELAALSERQMDWIRGSRMTMVFQDAMAALNPVFTIGRQLTEGMRLHLHLDAKAAKARAKRILRQVGLANPDEILRAYPHELSGGMQQRVMIAIALACDPKLLIADEPTTALDVTIQAQIMNLLKKLRDERQMSIILITHDMGLIAEMADRVLVMYAGQLLEACDLRVLLEAPAHPYTQLLLASVPSIEDDPNLPLMAIRGVVPEHYERLEGCRFRNRCPYADAACTAAQTLTDMEDGSRVRCWKASEGRIPRLGREEARRLVNGFA